MENPNVKEGMKNQMPLVAIRGSVVFPNTDIVLSFGRQKSVNAINQAFANDKVIAIFTQKDARTVDPKKEDLYEVGVVATITQMMPTEGEVHAVVRGQARVRLSDIISDEPYLEAKVEEIAEVIEDEAEIKALSNKLRELFKKSVNLGKPSEILTVMKLISGQTSNSELVDQIASILDIKTRKKQEILEITSLKGRLEKVLEYLAQEVTILELEKTISTKTQKRFEGQMRKAMLREKKKTIEQELGEVEEGDLSSEELNEYKMKIKKSGMPKEVRQKVEKELKRLSQMSPHNPEGSYIRNYLDWVTDLPWQSKDGSKMSISEASKVLEAEHYGIEKAKERILEYLAVMKIKETSKSTKKKADNEIPEASESQPTILCFMGPPGVGKTSIGKSIAKSLGREFVRVSLGGIRDEAEIRGHRRTYVGAMPGRIIQGIKNANSKNPVFMLDEIDKLGVDFRGDPSSALLEALDPEQNREFVDHYLGVPYDLSEVIFIATGNVLENIPHALRDRMEVINFAGYTQDEKFHIAKRFLWPKQLKLHGLGDKKINLSDEAINVLINRYTREAGVRNLERGLATVCRKIAKLVAEKKKYPSVVSAKQVRTFLGPEKFTSMLVEREDNVGLVTGLAVTASGGEILFIEVALMPGKGKLALTGQLGDVMKESAQAAFTWAKSHWQELGLKEKFNRQVDVHIHVPEGAVPKDGPSAGVAMATALVSALTGIAVRKEVGMTGEVTLRGRVLEIGGVKEKVIAGHRAGLKTIILPKDNEKNMEDVPKHVKDDIKFVFADNLEDALKVALVKWPAVDSAKLQRTPPHMPIMA